MGAAHSSACRSRFGLRQRREDQRLRAAVGHSSRPQHGRGKAWGLAARMARHLRAVGYASDASRWPRAFCQRFSPPTGCPPPRRLHSISRGGGQPQSKPFSPFRLRRLEALAGWKGASGYRPNRGDADRSRWLLRRQHTVTLHPLGWLLFSREKPGAQTADILYDFGYQRVSFSFPPVNRRRASIGLASPPYPTSPIKTIELLSIPYFFISSLTDLYMGSMRKCNAWGSGQEAV